MPQPPTGELEAALEAAHWLQARAVRTREGLGWRVRPTDPDVDRSLYSGSAGICVFLIELAAAADQAKWLEVASRAADDMAAALDRTPQTGLYDGIAGITFALTEVAAATGEARHAAAAAHGLDLVHKRASREADAISWGESNDVISGDAGIGMFLLWIAHRVDSQLPADLARGCARQLARLGDETGTGRRWSSGRSSTRRWPNFSHGTAGIGCFLAMSHQVSGDAAAAEAAIAAGAYLRSVSRPDGLVFHSEPGQESLHYLGWCHGPPGTARLYQQLAVMTGDRRWDDEVTRLADALLALAVPPRPHPGLWDNVSQCCGQAGIADFFVHLAAGGGGQRYREAISVLARYLMTSGTRDREGLSWVQAESRLRPQIREAQPGLMQGAAGIAVSLLRAHGSTQTAAGLPIALPDNPTARGWGS